MENDYDQILINIKDNYKMIELYRKKTETNEDQYIREYYKNAIESLKIINIALEKKLQERKTNPNL